MRSQFLAICSAALVATLAASAETTKVQTTRQMVDTLGEDLQKAWTDFPKDNQKTVRDTRVNDLNTTFNRDILKAELPPNLTVQRSIEQALTNVAKSQNYLKLASMQQERIIYANACLAAMRREVQGANDVKAARSCQQCFDLLLDMLTLMREKLHSAPLDIQQQVMAGIGTAVSDLVRNSSVPERPDPTTQMDLNVKEAHKKFPTTTDELARLNQPVVQLLEQTAKTIQQYAVSKK